MYYVLNQVLSMQLCFAKASKDVVVLNAILKKDFANVPKTHYKLAHDIFTDTMSLLDRVYLGSNEVPSSSLWRSSTVKEKADEKERKSLMGMLTPRLKQLGKDRKGSLKSDEPPPKNPKLTSTGGDKKGFLKCTQPNLFIPKGVFPDKPLCRSGARVDSVCPYGAKCNFIHVDSFNDFDRAQQKRCVKWIDSDQKVNFADIDETLLKSLRDEIADGNMS